MEDDGESKWEACPVAGFAFRVKKGRAVRAAPTELLAGKE